MGVILLVCVLTDNWLYRMADLYCPVWSTNCSTMSKPKISFLPGNFYHVYNHATGMMDLFRQKSDYSYFLRLYEKYMSPVADTFAWVLMKNHFHLLVRIKEGVRYKYSYADRSIDPARFELFKWETTRIEGGEENLGKKPKPHLHFSHLCNTYGKYYNKKYERHGSVFDRGLNRKIVDNITYLKSLTMYIHNNPVHHGFCDHAIEYPWSSYMSCISNNYTQLCRKEVLMWFNNKNEFIYNHNQNENFFSIEDWL